MITVEEIRKDLKDIKYYYTHQETFNEALKQLGENAIMEKVKKYNELIVFAPPQFYDLYYSLYVYGHTQQSLSDKLCYSLDNIKKSNRLMLRYFQKTINEREVNNNEQ